MELSRRDALRALAAASGASLAGCAAPTATDAGEASATRSPVGEGELATLVAVAGVVYPSSVTGVESFVRTYTAGRVDGDDEYARGVAESIDALDEYATALHGDPYAELSPARRRKTLDVMSVDVVDPDRDGTDAQRVRYYVVNELLFALYTSPTGAALAGLENPPGHPGGIESYREGPDA